MPQTLRRTLAETRVSPGPSYVTTNIIGMLQSNFTNECRVAPRDLNQKG